MSETLEEKARKIGDDITAVWNIIRTNGGVIPHKINTENLQDVLPQAMGLSVWNARGAYFFNPDGSLYDFYTTHEVEELTELPDLPAGATGWTNTLAEIKSALENQQMIRVGTKPNPAFCLTATMELTDSTLLSPTIYFKLTGEVSVNNRVDWGDGTTDVIPSTGDIVMSHTYSGVGTYQIGISMLEGNNISIGEAVEASESYMLTSTTFLGPHSLQSNASTSSNLWKYSPFLTSVYVGPGVTLGYAAFSAGVSYSTSASNYSHGGLVNAVLDNGQTVIPSFCFNGSSFASFVVPEGVKDMGNGAIANNNKLVSVTFPESTRFDFYYYQFPAVAKLMNLPELITINFPPNMQCQNFASIVKGAAKFNQLITLPQTVSNISNFITNCSSYNKPITIPNTVVKMDNFMNYCTSFNQPVVIPEGVTEISNLLTGCTSFNSPVTFPSTLVKLTDGPGNRDTGALIGCTNFNQPVTLPEGLLYMRGFLQGATKFNQPLVIPSTVVTIQAVLRNATSFNQPITIPANVERVGSFLDNATSFDSPITILSNKISNYGGDFNEGTGFLCGATSFNQPITIPDSTASRVTLTGAFYRTNSLTAPITVELPFDKITFANTTFATNSNLAASYTVGMTLTGTYASDWKNGIPDSSVTSYYRKLILGSN